MRLTAALVLAGHPRGCPYSASLGSMANFGFFDQIGWSAKWRNGGWLNAFEATMKALKLSSWNRNRMKSLARSAFFENFQMPKLLMGGAEWIPAGPPGLLWWLMSSAMGIFFARAALYGLTGLWIQAPFPESMKRLLAASSHESTSG